MKLILSDCSRSVGGNGPQSASTFPDCGSTLISVGSLNKLCSPYLLIYNDVIVLGSLRCGQRAWVLGSPHALEFLRSCVSIG